MDSFKAYAIKFYREEKGIGTLEIILILAVIVIIAVAFRKWIFGWFRDLLGNSQTEMNKSKTDITTIPVPDPGQ